MTRPLALIALLGCAGCYQRMADAPRLDPYEPSAFFADSLGMRPREAHTVARTDALEAPPDAAAGLRDARGQRVGVDAPPDAAPLPDAFPFPVTGAVLARGQQQFDVFCAPCHGRAGYGDGMVVARGLRPPPSFHTGRLRGAPAGHFVAVIENGYGAMYSYAARVAPADRWAIAAFIRALQRAQHATAADVPSDTLARLDGAVPAPRPALVLPPRQ